MKNFISIPDHLTTKELDKIHPEFFKALGDPTRLALVSYLAEVGKPSTVTEVSSCCGIDFSGVSRHLKILREAGIVKVTKKGRQSFYSLETDKITNTLIGITEILKNLSGEVKKT